MRVEHIRAWELPLTCLELYDIYDINKHNYAKKYNKFELQF